jgi:hypothetical protein
LRGAGPVLGCRRVTTSSPKLLVQQPGPCRALPPLLPGPNPPPWAQPRAAGRCPVQLIVEKKKKSQDMRLWFETWFAKVVLDSRDSVVLETWFEKDIRKDIRNWFETWFAKVVLDRSDQASHHTGPFS